MGLLRELPELDLGNHHRDTLKCEPTRNILLRPSRLPNEISSGVSRAGLAAAPHPNKHFAFAFIFRRHAEHLNPSLTLRIEMGRTSLHRASNGMFILLSR